jgi:hypothetical protein
MHTSQMPDESRHARRRRQQRGIRLRDLQNLLYNHDLDAAVGGNCRVLRISRDLALAEVGPQEAGRLARLAVIVSETTGFIVTVMHVTGRSRRYRGHR